MKTGIKYKHVLAIIPALILVVALTACSKSDEPDIAPRPYLENSEIVVPYGGFKKIKVINATNLSVTDNLDFVDIEVDGATLTFKAITYGKATLAFRADGFQLTCTVEVAGYDDKDLSDEPDIEFPLYPADKDTQMADNTPRVTIGTLALRFDSPGTLIASSSDATNIMAASLTTGVKAEFSCTSMPYMGSALPATILKPELRINGEKLDLLQAWLMKVDGNTKWIAAVTPDERNLWITVCPAIEMR